MNPLNLVPVLALSLSLLACSDARKALPALPTGLANLKPSNALACRFSKTLESANHRQLSDWYFWRSASRTETRDMLTSQGEIWERNQNFQLFYTRLFYNERIAMEFVPGDLLAIGTNPSWQQINSLIDPAYLGKELALIDTKNLNGNAVEHYQGTLNWVNVDLYWLPSLQLPAQLSKTLPEGSVTLNLLDCGPASEFSVQPLTKTEFDSLQRLDYTDLGDREDDPMVQRLERLMATERTHGHH